MLVRARFRGGGVRRGAPLVPVRLLGPWGVPCAGYAARLLIRRSRTGAAAARDARRRDERAAATARSIRYKYSRPHSSRRSRPARRRRRYRSRRVRLRRLGGAGVRRRRLPADSCPNGCSGRGFCRAAGCVCEAGFGGADCGIACSGEMERMRVGVILRP